MTMCNCCIGRRNCGHLCPCHHRSVIGGTRAGKTTMMLMMAARMQWEREHPNGVVQGQVVTDSGELEACP